MLNPPSGGPNRETWQGIRVAEPMGAESLFRFNPASAEIEELSVAEEAAADLPKWPVEPIPMETR